MVKKMLKSFEILLKLFLNLDEIEADSIAGSHRTKSVYSADSIIDDVQSPERVQSNDTSESDSIASPQKRQLDSSDESDLSKSAEDKKKVSKNS